MFISVLELFKPGIGPSSSHTMGPMVAASRFLTEVRLPADAVQVRCVLKGSLALTGHGHASDRAVVLGLHGHTPEKMALTDVEAELAIAMQQDRITMAGTELRFDPHQDVIFDMQGTLPEHPNGMVFELLNDAGDVVLARRYFSIGGGFINDEEEMGGLVAPLTLLSDSTYPFPFEGASCMMRMSQESGLSIAQMKRKNEYLQRSEQELQQGLAHIWQAMKACVERGLQASGELPGGLKVKRRAAKLHQQLLAQPEQAQLHEWLCAYAMAVNEENAAGHAVVTAPTNGAAGVIPAVLYYAWQKHQLSDEQIEDFLLTAGSVGGIIKHKSSISGAEVGCQGEVGSASAMAAAGLCAVLGGNAEQVEHAAEMALEHHLGMTCDPVKGLVQVPCIERNGFGALKAYTAASLALRDSGQHIMSLDNCIAAMKQTGLEMSEKYKETSLGGLAVNYTEC
ncbi:L-serine ammonia-lyase [Bacterioplanes sanyensis]|uniref:L-serine dehydratase n=1 Tax=Bacterioplanes sanyensis TaxID=1249553 RepID=A0A222FK03_9GAMM|nr:L-serine ammonia-lyase [Bacterioplanes sanyensis]ASP39110.1 L-serine ammonia-lyase [Bacterioplanes sanyensis]